MTLYCDAASGGATAINRTGHVPNAASIVLRCVRGVAAGGKGELRSWGSRKALYGYVVESRQSVYLADDMKLTEQDVFDRPSQVERGKAANHCWHANQSVQTGIRSANAHSDNRRLVHGLLAVGSRQQNDLMVRRRPVGLVAPLDLKPDSFHRVEERAHLRFDLIDAKPNGYAQIDTGPGSVQAFDGIVAQVDMGAVSSLSGSRNVNEVTRDLVRSLMAIDDYETSANFRKKVETLFGEAKRNLGFTRLRLRGLTGAAGEFLLAATVQNLKRLAKHATGPAIRRHFERA